MCQHFVAYFRVSTKRQGKSGLGLDAQQAAARAFIAGKGAEAKLLASFLEIESGKHADRPELAKAMEHARLTGAILLIAKLDRLSRDAHFLLGLKKAGVRFVAADMPMATELMVGMMAIFAQEEREMISARTRSRWRWRRRVIKSLAIRTGRLNAQPRQPRRLKAQAQQRATGLAATIVAIKAEGITSANGIARELNARHIATPRGGSWSARSVLNVTARI